MSDSICPICGKSNAGLMENCQYCGAVLMKNATEPLPPIRPGDVPEKRKTSDLERTLPGWLRDARKAAQQDGNLPEPEKSGSGRSSAIPLDNLPTNNPASDSPMDFLAGLTQLGDAEEDEKSGWLKNLQASLPTTAPLEPELPPEPEPESGISADIKPENVPDAVFQATEPAPDWLNALNLHDQLGGSGAQDGQPAMEADRDPSIYADLPDWLAALTGGPAQPEAKPDSRKPSSTPESPDWLSSLGGDFIAEEPAPFADQALSAEYAASPDMPDWLASLQGSDQPASGPARLPSVPETSAAPQVGGMPDWLASLQGSDQPASGPASPPSMPETSAAPQAGGMPDWLASLQSSDQPASGPASLPSVPETSAALPAGDMPDWLASLQGSDQPASGSASLPSVPETSAALPAGDLPDWLASLQGSAQPASGAASLPSVPETSAELPASDMPDWLASLQGSDQPASGSASLPLVHETSAALPAGDLSDWLSSLQSSDQASSGPPNISNAPIVPAFEGASDWLSILQGSNPDVDATASLPVSTKESVNPNSDGSPQQNVKPFSPGTLGEFDEPGSGNGSADWNLGAGQVLPVEDKPVLDALSVAESPENAGTALISEVDHLMPGGSAEQNIDSILSMDAPDWLSGLAHAEVPQDAAPDDLIQTSPDLRLGELPSWVQAMRPMESVMQGSSFDGDEQEIEHQGPLAGLRSVLPTQPGLVELHKPKAYSTQLITNETQQTQSALLENLLHSENTPRVLSKREGTSLARPIRWLIAAVLLLVILIIAALGTKIFPAPVMPVEASPVGSFLKVITALPDGAPVLLVMDYQLGFAGELESAAGPVLEHLMSKKTRLTFISTTPFGDLMADRLLQKFSSIYKYEPGIQYINLGYLPGGSASIRAFAERPGATLGKDVLLGNLWDLPALKDVNVNSEPRLSSFATLIVLTDNPDTGRLWVEQAGPALGSKPMLMIVSSQAEPMIQPYVSSNQLDGLLVGLEGGMLYEGARGKFGQARIYWDSFGAGMLVAELSLVIGGVWSLIAGLRARRASMEQEEA